MSRAEQDKTGRGPMSREDDNSRSGNPGGNPPPAEPGSRWEQLDVTSRMLEESEASRRAVENIIERISDGFVAFDNEWRFRYVNDVAARILNREPEELIGKRSADEFPEGIGLALSAACRRAAESQVTQFVEDYYPPYERWFETRIFPSATGLSIFFQDVTERRQREDELRRKNRSLMGLSACNRALLRATDEGVLLREICRICVEIAGYRMAWVGYAEHDAEKTVRLVAQAGLDEGYLEEAGIVWSDTVRGRGPTGTAIREGKTVIARDVTEDCDFAPWRELALRHGFRSTIGLPLVSEGDPFGALSVYSSELDAFDAEETALLEEFAADLAFGVAALRLRA
jgi:PAS domain S-box-containing protein